MADFAPNAENGRLSTYMLEGYRKPEAASAAIEKDFLAAFDEHSDALFRHCLIRVRDREQAKDVVAETYTKTWTYLSEGKKVEHLRAFLYRVANNLIVDQSRRKRSSSLDAMIDDDGFEAIDESVANPADIPDARAAVELLKSMDGIYRQVITMRFMDGLSPKEIAQILEVSENVVSVRLHRGMERLRELANKEPPRPLIQ
jgi:RNA polymerase sigma-70 factor (ECF subfamily)